MKIHRFIGSFSAQGGPASGWYFQGNEVKIESPENIKQIKGILRLEPGEHIILGDGAGMEAEVELIELNKKSILGKVLDKRKVELPPKEVHLYLAILKKENFELATQKSVECGVASITPMITTHTVKTGIKADRLEKIILEASEQSGRAYLPKLNETTKFNEAIQSAGGEKMLFDSSGEKLKSRGFTSGNISIFIGPEGGFTDEEIVLAKESDAKVVTLGPLTLRGETAAIVTTYLATN